MNLHALILLYSLSTAIAIPFNSDSQLLDPDPQTDFLAGNLANQADTPNPLDVNQYTSPGNADSSIPPNSELQQSHAPVQPSATGEDVCCADKLNCRKQDGLMGMLCYSPEELYNCPDGYNGDLNGCDKLGTAPRKQPSWPGAGESIWLLGICFKKPKPAFCPEFFNKFGP